MLRHGQTSAWVFLAVVLLLQAIRSVQGAGRLEVFRVYVSGSTEACWQTMRFSNAFEEAPVVVAMTTTQGTDPAKIRVRAVTNASFEVCITEPWETNNLKHGVMYASLIAASPGVHKLPDGRIFEAGFLETMQRRAARCRPLDFPNKGWEKVYFAHSFLEPPALLTELQTANNEVSSLPAVPWLVVGACCVTSSQASLTLDSVVAFDGGQINVPEQIGYIAFDSAASTTEITVPAVRACQAGQEVLIRSWSGEYLQDNDGVLELAADAASGDSSRWMTTLSNSRVIFTSHRSVRLTETDSSSLALEASGSGQEWEIVQADGDQVYLFTQSGRKLTDDGTLQLRPQSVVSSSEDDDYYLPVQRWMLLDASTREPCPDVVEAPSTADRTISYAVVRSDPFADMGWNEGGQLVAFGNTLSNSAPLVVASLITRNGADGGWLRQKRDETTSAAAKLRIDENKPENEIPAFSVSLVLSSGPWSASFAESNGSVGWFNVAAVNATNFVDPDLQIFRDDTVLHFDLLCNAATNCLHALRFGSSTLDSAWTVASINAEYSPTVGQWQSVQVSLDGSSVSYSGTIPWDALDTFELMSESPGTVSWEVKNLMLQLARSSCTDLSRSHGSSERVAMVAFDESFSMAVDSTSTTSTSSSTDTVTSSTRSSTSTFSSTSTGTTSSTSTTTSSSSSTSTTTSSSSSTSTTTSSTSSSSSSSASTTTSTATHTSTSSSTRSSTTTSSKSYTITTSSTSCTTLTVTSTTSRSITRTLTSTTSSRSTTLTLTATTSSSRTSTSLTSTSSQTATTSHTSSSTSTTSPTSTTTRSSTRTSSSSSSLSSTTTTRSTSQSTSTLTAGSIAAALTNELQRNTNFLLSQLTNVENSTASATTSLGTMKAVELKGAPGNSSFVAAVVDGSAAAVVLPLEALGELGESAVLVLTTFDGPEASELGSGQKAQTKASRPIEAATPAVDISIVDKDSLSAQEVQVRTPIFVRIAEVAAEPNWICAYLDGDTWSTEGVRLATPAELETAFGDQADTSGVWCATLHLSIFGAFIDILLDCTNANMLSQEGLREIVERQGWWMRPPALGLWLLLAPSLLLIGLGRLRDARVHRSGFWRDEYFLTDLPPVPQSLPCLCGTAWFGSRKEPQTTDDGDASHEEEEQKAEEANEAEEAEDSPAQGARGRRPSQSSLPSIMSKLSWLRAGIPDPQSMQLRHDLLQRLKPNLAAGMQERVICRNTLWEVARQHNVHTSSIQTHIWGRSGWVQGSLAVQRSPQLKVLAYELEETLPRAFVEVHTSRAQRLWAAMVASHPVYELWMCDLHMTAAKRAKIMMDCLLGSLAFVALFFSVDGTAVAARSPAECPIDQGSFLWYIFVAMFSILLNFVPRRLEIYLARRGFVQESRLNRRWQLRVRRLKDVGFWAFSFCLSGLHLLVVSAFLANMAEVDEGKWMFTFFVVLLRKFVLVPLLACLFSSLGTELSGWGQERIMPPRKLGLDLQLDGQETLPTAESDKQVWLDKVKELAGRGITIRQLLDFYVELGHEVMKHFDPKKSTTHDVVRQAIIPRSLQLRDSRYLVVVVHRATGLAALDLFSGSDPYCVVSVQGSGGVSKPWKGGGRTPYVSNDQNPVWEESFLVEDVLHEEVLHFTLWDHDFASKDDSLGNASLPVSNCWHGLRGVLDVRDGREGGRLYVSIKAYETPDEAQAAWRPPEKALRFISASGSLSAVRSSVRKQKSGGAPDECFDLWDTDECTAVGSRLAKKFIPSASRGVLAEDPHAQGEDEAATGEYHGYAYAAVMNSGRPHFAQKMVTHSWQNIFSHLIAAILADALDVEKYDEIAKLLVKRNFSTLSDALRRKNSLDVRYWVCAFSVNQHAGICATPPPVDSTGHAIAPCRCGTPKHFAGDLSEMNKFDDMMAFLKRTLRQQQGQVRLEQVIALETDFALLTRVWCVAELVEANELHLQQAVKIHSASSRDVCLDRLVQLDVRSAQASFPADKDFVLNKIQDVEDFNTRLQDLMLHRMEFFLQTSRASTAADLFDEAILAVVNVAI